MYFINVLLTYLQHHALVIIGVNDGGGMEGMYPLQYFNRRDVVSYPPNLL